MTDYKKILVAVDGSGESERILDAAGRQAGPDTELHTVMVFEPLLGNYSFELDLADFEKVQQEHQERVAAATREMVAARLPSLKSENIHFLRGKPSSEIRRLAREINADLLVIGSHGHNPVAAMLGSVASGVLHGIHCDVLTVRVGDGA